ncbi:MAG: PAS domain-containing protein [Chitinophagaceae bacterium]|nr:PAS domain-containing protein [Chitinophagaceae bacterium]
MLVLGIDMPSFTIMDVNDAFFQLSDVGKELLIGQPFFSAMSAVFLHINSDDEHVERAALTAVIENARQQELPIRKYISVSLDQHEVADPYRKPCGLPLQEKDGTVTAILLSFAKASAAAHLDQSIISNEEQFETESDFFNMADIIPQQIWTSDPAGAITYINRRTSSYFGKSSAEIIGSGWQAFIHPADLPGCLKTWSECLESGRSYEIEFRLLGRDQKYKWHLSRAIPVFKNGSIIKWLGTNTDIEDHKESERKKDEFISIASHELKTPLTSLRAYMQLLERHEVTEPAGKFIRNSMRQLLRLEGHVNDFLDVSKISNGKLIYNISTFDFSEMLKDAVESVQQSSLNHKIIIENNEQVTIQGDRHRLEQVITNFLTNAIKYSPNAQEVIISSEHQQDHVMVSVKDFGIGIENNHLEHLFDRFYRVDNTSSRYEGLGLGLYISSEILKRHGGTFWIESEPGQGSIFFFRLPVSENISDAQYVTTDDAFVSDSITIVFKENTALLEVNWKGYQTFKTVQAGGAMILEFVRRHNVTKVVNDNREVLGSWSDAAEWAGKEWFPMMDEAGVRLFAWIQSPTTFSKLSAEKSVDLKVGNVVTQFFTIKEEALVWIAENS